MREEAPSVVPARPNGMGGAINGDGRRSVSRFVSTPNNQQCEEENFVHVQPIADLSAVVAFFGIPVGAWVERHTLQWLWEQYL